MPSMHGDCESLWLLKVAYAFPRHVSASSDFPRLFNSIIDIQFTNELYCIAVNTVP
jgi:hypothetical protein